VALDVRRVARSHLIVLALFDKWFEGRETQAAESWRVPGVPHGMVGTERDSGESAFQSHHHDGRFGAASAARIGCRV
jgi:hypothetical protein